MQIKLGQKVRDPITGLRGTAVCRTTWLYGCVRIGIQPQEVKDGKPADLFYVDEPQLEIIEKTAAKKVAKPVHGPRSSDSGRSIDNR